MSRFTGCAENLVLCAPVLTWHASPLPFTILSQEEPLAAANLAGVGVLLLQREVPEAVNLRAAQAAAVAGVPVLLVRTCVGLKLCTLSVVAAVSC
jgi:hypothetical protein